MLIEGKYCSLETDDPVKGQAIVNYVDWTYEQNKEQIMKEAFEAWMYSERLHEYNGSPKSVQFKDENGNV